MLHVSRHQGQLQGSFALVSVSYEVMLHCMAISEAGPKAVAVSRVVVRRQFTVLLIDFKDLLRVPLTLLLS